MFRDLIAHRDLLWLLTVREIRIRYARAFLGAAWAMFLPLVMMAVFTVMNFSSLIPEGNPYKDLPYTVFAYCGLLPWTHFATSMTQATPSLVRGGQLMRKSAFPQEVIPLSVVFAALLDLAIGAVMLGLLIAWYPEVSVSLPALSLLPVFALQFLFTAGVALVLAAGNMFFRDVNYLVQVGVLLAMFVTSVVYPIPATNPWLSKILEWNPMSSYLDAYREALLLGVWPSWETLRPGVFGALLSIVVGYALFRRVAPRLAEEV